MTTPTTTSTNPVAERRIKAPDPARLALVKKWAYDPWAFFTGIDTDGRPILWTKDEKDWTSPFKPFPHKEHVMFMLQDMFRDEPVYLLEKSRQMMASTTCMLALYWIILFQVGRKVFVSKQTEDEAVTMMRDKIAGPHGRTPTWFQECYPLRTSNQKKIVMEDNESEIIAVAQNAAVRAFRGNMASVVLIDEAAFQEFFNDMLVAVAPMGSRVWAITSANVGNPGAETFKRLKDEKTAV